MMRECFRDICIRGGECHFDLLLRCKEDVAQVLKRDGICFCSRQPVYGIQECGQVVADEVAVQLSCVDEILRGVAVGVELGRERIEDESDVVDKPSGARHRRRRVDVIHIGDDTPADPANNAISGVRRDVMEVGGHVPAEMGEQDRRAAGVVFQETREIDDLSVQYHQGIRDTGLGQDMLLGDAFHAPNPIRLSTRQTV